MAPLRKEQGLFCCTQEQLRLGIHFLLPDRDLMITAEDEYDIFCLATLDNKSYEELAQAYEVSEEEIEQIVLRHTKRG